MLLYHILQHFWLGLGASEGVFRSLSVLFAVATVPPFYLLAARLFTVWTATSAVVLLAVNAFFIQYAQEARAYAPLVFLTVLASALLVRALDRPTRARWLAYVIVTGLALYTHFFASLIIMAQLLAVLAWRPRVGARVFFLVFGSIAVIALPLLMAARAQGMAISWVPPLTLGYARSVLEWLVGSTAPGPLLAVYSIVCGGGVVFALVRRQWRWEWLCALMLATIPIVVAVLVSLVRPMFVPRYLIVALPGIVIVAAASLSLIRPRWLGTGAVVGLALIASLNLQGWYIMPKEDWRAAVQYVSQHAEPGDELIAYPAFTRLAIDHYLRRQPTDPVVRPLYPTPDWGEYFPAEADGLPFPEPVAGESKPRRVWVVYRYAPPGPESAAGKAIAAVTDGRPPASETLFPAVGVRLYELAP